MELFKAVLDPAPEPQIWRTWHRQLAFLVVEFPTEFNESRTNFTCLLTDISSNPMIGFSVTAKHELECTYSPQGSAPNQCIYDTVIQLSYQSSFST